MPPKIQCLGCGAIFLEAIGPCALCGGEIELSVALTGNQITTAPGQLGAVADSPTINSGQQIRYKSPKGAKSEASLVGGSLHAQIYPPVDIGRPGEPRVMSCVMAYLTKAGKNPVMLSAIDKSGEDGVLEILDERVTVQIVAASAGQGFWGQVAQGGSEVHVELNGALPWIYSAISEKAKRYPSEYKKRMLLAVDVAHLGVLAGQAFGEKYLKQYGDPTTKFNFGAVWLVGPTENNVLILGTSQW